MQRKLTPSKGMELIKLHREYTRQTVDLQKAKFKNRLASEFKNIIHAEETVIGLKDIQALMHSLDPNSSDFPSGLINHLANKIANQEAIDLKPVRAAERARQRAQRRGASNFAVAQ